MWVFLSHPDWGIIPEIITFFEDNTGQLGLSFIFYKMMIMIVQRAVMRNM